MRGSPLSHISHILMAGFEEEESNLSTIRQCVAARMSKGLSRVKTKRVQEKNTIATRRALKSWSALAAAVFIASVALFVLQDVGHEGAQTAHGRTAPSLGDPDAPVTIIQYADFQCVYCRMFALDIQPDLVKEFVETGR